MGRGALVIFPPALWDVLHRAWLGGISLQSDYARGNAVLVAYAASAGYLSTIDPASDSYGYFWRITSQGLAVLNNKELFKHHGPT